MQLAHDIYTTPGVKESSQYFWEQKIWIDILLKLGRVNEVEPLLPKLTLNPPANLHFFLDYFEASQQVQLAAACYHVRRVWQKCHIDVNRPKLYRNYSLHPSRETDPRVVLQEMPEMELLGNKLNEWLSNIWDPINMRQSALIDFTLSVDGGFKGNEWGFPHPAFVTKSKEASSVYKKGN